MTGRADGGQVHWLLAGDQALVGQQLAYLVHGGIWLGDDQLRRTQQVSLGRRADLPHPSEQRRQRGPEGRLVTPLDRCFQRRVELVQLARNRFRHLKLTLAQDPDDHSGSPGSTVDAALAGAAAPSLEPAGALSICRGAPPWASSAFICSSSRSTP